MKMEKDKTMEQLRERLNGSGVRQLKIHKSSKSDLIEFLCCMDVVRRCTLCYNAIGGIPYETKL